MKALIIGDAAVATGFSRLTHSYAEGLLRREHDVHVLGINYWGEPHKHPFPIYPCVSHSVPNGDAFGVARTKEMLEHLRPDVCVLINDPWNVPAYLKRTGNTPVVASLAVDGKNCRGFGLNGLKHAIFWTEFGLLEARLGGYQGSASVIGLGVDLEKYSPMSQMLARERLKIPMPKDLWMNGFFVGVVGRNQPRKRLDLTMMAFAHWIKKYQIEDAYLFLHVAPTGDAGYDILQLGDYLGVSNKLILVEPKIGQGVSEEAMRLVYNSFDIMISTTQGEGWGLTHMEAMACGVPCALPQWAALAEWAQPAAMLVPCDRVICTPNNVNAVGGVVNEEAMVAAMQSLYLDKALRERMSLNGLSLVAQSQYRWETVGDEFARTVEEIVQRQVVEVSA